MTSTSPSAPPRGSSLRGGLLMIGLAVVLGWLPLVGPLVAGVVGGREVGRGSTALVVALVPAIVLGVLLGAAMALFDLPVLGALAGVGAFLFVAFQEIPLLIGAYAGGRMVE